MQYLSPFPGFRKSRQLSRREEELRHAIKHRHERTRIERAAERVRSSRLHLIKALQHSLRPCCSTEAVAVEARLNNLTCERAFWEERSIESIINEYANAGT